MPSSYLFIGDASWGGAQGPPKISWLTKAMNLKFWPVVGRDNWGWYAKFQIGQRFGEYFTDQNAKSAQIVYLANWNSNLMHNFMLEKDNWPKKSWSRDFLVLSRPVCKILNDPPPEQRNYFSHWFSPEVDISDTRRSSECTFARANPCHVRGIG